MSQRIELIITPQGETRLETKGFQGVTCQQASRFLEQALGQRDSETLTGEFYQQAHHHNRLQEGS